MDVEGLLIELVSRAGSASADADSATGQQSSYWAGMEDAYRDAIAMVQRWHAAPDMGGE